MSGIQLVGNANNTTAVEVEVGTKALRAVIRPDDIGSLGTYRLGANNGTTVMAAGLAAASDIFQWRYSTGVAGQVCVVKRVCFEMGSGSTGFAAGVGTFNMFRATAYSASGTGGATFFPGTGNKLRTSMGSSVMTSGNSCDIRCATTAALGAGTKTNDAQPIGSISVPVPTTANTQLVPVNSFLFDARVGEFPLVLVNNEGFSIQATVPATGTWWFKVSVDWQEMAAY